MDLRGAATRREGGRRTERSTRSSKRSADASLACRSPSRASRPSCRPDVEPLAQIFPAFYRVPAVARKSIAPDRDPLERRRSAFRAFVELLCARISAQQRLVITIDDLPLDFDADSLARSSKRCFSRPTRRRSSSSSRCAPRKGRWTKRRRFCRRCRATCEGSTSGGSRATTRRALAQSLAESSGAIASDVDAIAAEAAGHPLFIDELVRHAALTRDQTERAAPASTTRSGAARRGSIRARAADPRDRRRAQARRATGGGRARRGARDGAVRAGGLAAAHDEPRTNAGGARHGYDRAVPRSRPRGSVRAPRARRATRLPRGDRFGARAGEELRSGGARDALDGGGGAGEGGAQHDRRRRAGGAGARVRACRAPLSSGARAPPRGRSAPARQISASSSAKHSRAPATQARRNVGVCPRGRRSEPPRRALLDLRPPCAAGKLPSLPGSASTASKRRAPSSRRSASGSRATARRLLVAHLVPFRFLRRLTRE